jgi:hypothetical protein
LAVLDQKEIGREMKIALTVMLFITSGSALYWQYRYNQLRMAYFDLMDEMINELHTKVVD